jgi:type IV secretion system protein VirB10
MKDNPNPPNSPKIPPPSPDSLEQGLRGRVTGVTRIGPRAFLAAFLLVFGMLLAILYGVTRTNQPQQTAANVSTVPIASAVPSNPPHFGENLPVFPSTAPATPPPPLVLPPTPVPNVENDSANGSHSGSGSGGTEAIAPHIPSAAEVAEQQRESAREAEVAAERERERVALEAAAKSPILAQAVPQSGGSNVSGQEPVQVAYASSNGTDGSPGMTGFAGNGGSAATSTSGLASNASYASGGVGSPNNPYRASTLSAVTGGTQSNQSAATNTNGSVPAPVATGFINGPFGEYQVGPANVKIPTGGNSSDFLQAQRFGYVSPFEIIASSVIPSELVTAVDTDEPGLITGQVRENVYDSKTGRYLLIPKGSRLIGAYSSGIQFGQARLLVAWRRIIFPDTTSIDLLSMTGADVNGSAGLAGNVDNHDGRLFSAALLTSILSAGAALAGGDQNYSVLTGQTAGQAVSQQVAAQIANLGTTIVNRYSNVPPTLHIPKGYPFLVIVDRDIVFPGPYRGQ